jgi:hypothetical protein
MLTQASVKDFIESEPIVEEISREIAIRKGQNINNPTNDYSDTIERLNIVGLSSLEDIKKDLEEYKTLLIEFATRFMNPKTCGYISYEVPIIQLCYFKLALLGNINDILTHLKLFPLNITSEIEYIELANQILLSMKQ